MTLLQTRLERRAQERRIAERNEALVFAVLTIIGAGLLILAVLPWTL